MNKRTRAKGAALVVAGLIAVGLASDVAEGQWSRGNSPILLVYVGAEDCAPCRTWRRDQKPGFLDSIDRTRVDYREVIAPRLTQAFAEPIWPADLRPYRSSAESARGVPLWLVIRDERVVAMAGGLSLWRTRMLPLLQRKALRT